MTKKSNYAQVKEKLEGYRCHRCHGLGYIDDAEPGDIAFRQIQCPDCDGTGVNTNRKLEIISQVIR